MRTTAHPDLARRLGENVQRYRRECGLSQEALGFKTDMHRTHIGNIERGELLPRADVVVKLAGAFGVTVNDVLAGIRWKPAVIRRGGLEVRPIPGEGRD